MQCSIFSNTMYKTELHWRDAGFPSNADPSVKQQQASCIFKTATFQSIVMVQKKLLCADSIIAHIKEKKTEKKKKSLPVNEAFTVPDFITV